MTGSCTWQTCAHARTRPPLCSLRLASHLTRARRGGCTPTQPHHRWSELAMFKAEHGSVLTGQVPVRVAVGKVKAALCTTVDWVRREGQRQPDARLLLSDSQSVGLAPPSTNNRAQSA